MGRGAERRQVIHIPSGRVGRKPDASESLEQKEDTTQVFIGNFHIKVPDQGLRQHQIKSFGAVASPFHLCILTLELLLPLKKSLELPEPLGFWNL